MKFEKKLESESLRLLGVSSFGSWDPEVLNKSKESNINAHPALGIEGIGVHYAQAPLHGGKKKISLCLNSKFYQQRIPLQQKATNNSHK
jgi:hypothetical protein